MGFTFDNVNATPFLIQFVNMYCRLQLFLCCFTQFVLVKNLKYVYKYFKLLYCTEFCEISWGKYTWKILYITNFIIPCKQVFSVFTSSSVIQPSRLLTVCGGIAKVDSQYVRRVHNTGFGPLLSIVHALHLSYNS